MLMSSMVLADYGMIDFNNSNPNIKTTQDALNMIIIFIIITVFIRCFFNNS